MKGEIINFNEIKQFTPDGYYRIDVSVRDFKDTFENFVNKYGLVLNPWCDKNGYDVPAVETEIYKFATKFANFLANGRAKEKGLTAKDVDPKELKMGIEVEKEHTPDEDVVTRIALDHLAELPDYYTKLKKMEGD